MGILDAPGLSLAQARRQVAVPCANRAFPPNLASSNLSDGVITSATYRLTHTVTKTSHSVRLAFINAYNNLGNEVNGLNDITIRASIEPSAGSPVPVFFGGKRTTVVEPGAVIFSDPVAIELTQGATIFTRTYVQVASGGKWPLGISTSGTRAGEGNTIGASAGADWTTSAWNVGSTTIAGTAYGPASIVGIPATVAKKTTIVVGDSIADGVGEAAPNQNIGYVERGLGYTDISYQKLAYPSAGISNFSSPSSAARKQLIPAVATDAIVELGINAVASGATFATLQTSFLNIWNELNRRGLKVWQTTLTPSTTSTDAWATLANQSPQSFEAVRVQINNWIRTTPAPLAGYLEIADLAESDRNSGKWRVDLGQPSTDGVHPTTAVATAMAAGVPAASFK